MYSVAARASPGVQGRCWLHALHVHLGVTLPPSALPGRGVCGWHNPDRTYCWCGVYFTVIYILLLHIGAASSPSPSTSTVLSTHYGYCLLPPTSTSAHHGLHHDCLILLASATSTPTVGLQSTYRQGGTCCVCVHILLLHIGVAVFSFSLYVYRSLYKL